VFADGPRFVVGNDFYSLEDYMTLVSKPWQNVVVVLAIVLVGSLSPVAPTQARTIQRPLEDFLDAQGSYCIDDGAGGCSLFVPPDPNFLGFGNDIDTNNDGVIDTQLLFAGVDYAGLADAAYPDGYPQITGKVMERTLRDGRVEVTVLLHTQGANFWVIELDPDDDDPFPEIAGDAPTLFGHRPIDVVAGETQALADTFLHVVFINTEAGAPLPDLIQFVVGDVPEGVELKFLKFVAHAQGTFTGESDVAADTSGACNIVQTGIFVTSFQGALSDGFPAEFIKCRPTGQGSDELESEFAELSMSIDRLLNGGVSPSEVQPKVFLPVISH
jgi:hypothetical protein